MEDVAKAAGVSRALVSLAYRNAPGVSTASRERILKTGSDLGYRHNRIAAALASKGGKTLGVHLLDLHNDVFADMFDGIRETLDSTGHHLVLSVGTIDGSLDLSALHTLQQSRVTAIIAAGLLLSDAAAHEIAAATPLICASRVIDGLDSVSADDHEGARLATQHLIDLGHSRIAFLANPPSDGYGLRLAGYHFAMRAAGLPPLVAPSAYSRDIAARDTTALLATATPPTAIIAHNDQAAFGALDAAADRGVAVPEELSIVGYDDSSPSRAPGTALTTVAIRGREIGQLAAQAALARLDDRSAPPLRTILTPRLAVRATTAPPAR
ncbi:LacI family DNA-binding transcriptional regulator [Micrococcales bacterium 31B]|nr:LacI family DNA-binding transcriptional regulator [Micrococcales bacterium 31B]